MANHRSLTEEQEKEAARMYLEENMSLAAVSLELGVHRSTVEGALRRQGVTLSPRGAGKPRKATTSQAAEANDISNLQLRQGRHGKGVVLCCAECGSSNLVERPLN